MALLQNIEIGRYVLQRRGTNCGSIITGEWVTSTVGVNHYRTFICLYQDSWYLENPIL